MILNLTNVENVIIEKNLFSEILVNGTIIGILISNSTNVEVRNNDFQKYGVNSSTILGSEDIQFGVYFLNSTFVSAYANHFGNLKGTNAAAIVGLGVESASVYDNQITTFSL